MIIGQSDAAAAVAFADDLARDCAGLQGVVGALAAARGVRAAVARADRRARTGLRVRLRQHALTAVNDVPAAPGAARIATRSRHRVADRGAASRSWRKWALPDPPARVREHPARARAARRVPGLGPRRARGLRRLQRRGPRFRADRAGLHAARVAAGAATRPRSSQRCRASSSPAASARLFLTTDVANPTSNAIYARIGFRAENDDWHFDFVAPEA